MRRLLKNLLRLTPAYTPLKSAVIVSKQTFDLARWHARGRPTPPPHTVKQFMLKQLTKRFKCRVFVETGTYRGDMLEAMTPHFERLYSIELSAELYQRAKERFRENRRVELIHGDSGLELGKVLQRVKQPALLWLDGHYSGGVTAKSERDPPIFAELGHIFASETSEHLVVIDDARCFGAHPGYPSVEDLCGFIKTHRPTAQIEVECDSIRILPATAARTHTRAVQQ
jgi:hypothetical protein